MFTKITPTTDSQLTAQDVTNLVVNDAITKISQLSGLNEQQAFALLTKQVNRHVNDNQPRNIIARYTPIVSIMNVIPSPLS